MKMRLKHVVRDMDRHGNVRIYVRHGGRKIRVRDDLGSPEFMATYASIIAGNYHSTGTSQDVHQKPVCKDSVRGLCIEYFKSSSFRTLDPRTQRVRRRLLERFCEHNSDGEKPFRLLMPRHIRQRRDEMVDRPEAANGMIKALRQAYKFAIDYDMHDRNPAADVGYLKPTNPDGFAVWLPDEVAKFEAFHPVGSKARLALALALYTGQRRSDIVAMGEKDFRHGYLVLTQHKNRNRSPVRLELPVVPELRRVIDATPGGETFLVTEFGKPFTSNGFGNWFRTRCDEAEVFGRSMHGLRKVAASRLAEAGCSEHEIMAITGHRTSKEVTRYTRAANQKIRATSAMKRLEQKNAESPTETDDPPEWDENAA